MIGRHLKRSYQIGRRLKAIKIHYTRLADLKRSQSNEVFRNEFIDESNFDKLL